MTATDRWLFFGVIRSRDFARFWLGRALVAVGGSVIAIAAAVLAFRLTGSALSVALVLVAHSASGMVAGLFAGALVDRADPRRVAIAARLLMALASALAPLALAGGVLWLYVGLALIRVCYEFDDAAQACIVPHLAGPEQLGAATALLQVSVVGAGAVGGVLAGALLSATAAEHAFFLNAALAGLAALGIAPLRNAPPPAEPATAASTARDLADGARYLLATPALRSLLIVTMFGAACAGLLNASLLPFAARALGASAAQYGLLEGIQAGGFIVGGLLLALLIDRLHTGQWTAISYSGVGICTAALALAPGLGWGLALNLALGAVNAPSYVARSLIVQRETPRNARGRVSSAISVARNLALAAGLLGAGLADVVGVRAFMFATGAGYLACGLLTLTLPGLSQPGRVWRRALDLSHAAALGAGCAAAAADIDALAGLLPALAALEPAERLRLAGCARVYDAPAGTAVVRQGEAGDMAYFVLAGRLLVSRREHGRQRLLEILGPGDFFGEIAALAGLPRTADVVVERDATLLQLPADALRQLAAHVSMNRLVFSRLTTRMARMHLIDLPSHGGYVSSYRSFPDADAEAMRYPDSTHIELTHST